MAHYLYPLNPKSRQGYFFEDAFGNRFPTSLEGFLDCYRGRGEAAEWAVAKCGSRLKKGDYIWVYFSKPVGAVMAVGRVSDAVHFMADHDRDGVWIDWDWDLTDKLLDSPIVAASLQQRVPYSVTPVDSNAHYEIRKWLARNRKGIKSSRRSATGTVLTSQITFKTVEVEQRQGQPAFRRLLMTAYDNRCAVTGCSVRDVLQAAHVVAVKDKGDHGVSNGILLRADLHNLFDRGLMYFDQTGRVRFADVVKDDEYTRYEGKRCALVLQNVDKRALELHRKKHKR